MQRWVSPATQPFRETDLSSGPPRVLIYETDGVPDLARGPGTLATQQSVREQEFREHCFSELSGSCTSILWVCKYVKYVQNLQHTGT